MAILPILTFPDPRLHTKAKPIAVVDERIKKLADDMAETMYKAPGIGLAATQVNVHERLLVTDVSEERNDLRVLINPKIIRAENFVKNQEGCLSVPGIYDDVDRAQSITVEALDRNGEAIQFDAEGLLAVCIQHEMDHLDGKVFVEYLSMFKQSRIKTKMKKRARELEQE
jgi:peptide deformylase